MSCLMEFIMELLLEGFFEIMWALFPKSEKKMTKRKEGWIRLFVALYAVALLLCIFIGILLLGEGSAVGYYLIFIPLGIIVVNIILSIIIKILRHKKRESPDGFLSDCR